MGVVRRTFTNPVATDVVIDVAGDSFQIEDMSEGNDIAANRTTIHPTDYTIGAGIPVISRLKVKYNAVFDRLIVHLNSSATTDNEVTILIWNSREVDINLPSL